MFIFAVIFWLYLHGEEAEKQTAVTAKTVIIPLDSSTIFPETAEYLNDRKTITAVLVHFLFTHAQNRHYLYFRSEIWEPSFSATAICLQKYWNVGEFTF